MSNNFTVGTGVPRIFNSPPCAEEKELCTDFYVWRHGETDSNVSKILSGGGDDVGLNDMGLSQAEELGKKISEKLDLDVIYSSDLERAIKTAEAVRCALKKNKIPSIICVPQLREILHGKFERKPAAERGKLFSLLVKEELANIEKLEKDVPKGIEEGRLDRFHFWKIHPMSGRRIESDAKIIDVKNFFKSKMQEPETVFELFQRVHEAFINIAEESSKLGQTKVGISTHGAVLSTLVSAAKYGDINVFAPPFYQTDEIQKEGKGVFPEAIKISNCALLHFRYWPKSRRLEFCEEII